jgi:hypothetical protein
MHMVMEETKGKNAPSIRHKGPRATLLPAGWMDGWLYSETDGHLGWLVIHR